MSDSLDIARLRRALADARAAFPPEFALRRVENLPLLKIWDQINLIDSLVARTAQGATRTTRTVPLRQAFQDENID